MKSVGRSVTERVKYILDGLLVRFGPETPILASVPYGNDAHEYDGSSPRHR